MTPEIVRTHRAVCKRCDLELRSATPEGLLILIDSHNHESHTKEAGE
jgi:hypothetical protein